MRILALAFLLVFSGLAADGKKSAPAQRIDLNNASQATLETLPGVGPKLAEQIIAARPFRAINDLDKVHGIGPKKLEKIRPYVFILPMTNAAALPDAPQKPSKINLNTATQAELETLPGVGPKRAEQIIHARPFKNIQDLQKVPGLRGAPFEKVKNLVAVQ